MKKTALYLVIAAALVFSLSGCGTKQTGTVTTSPTADISVTGSPLPTSTPALSIAPDTSPDIIPDELSPNVSASPGADAS